MDVSQGERIQIARQRRGLTLANAAAEIGIGAKTLWRVEHGFKARASVWSKIFEVFPEADHGNDSNDNNESDGTTTSVSGRDVDGSEREAEADSNHRSSSSNGHKISAARRGYYGRYSFGG